MSSSESNPRPESTAVATFDRGVAADIQDNQRKANSAPPSRRAVLYGAAAVGSSASAGLVAGTATEQGTASEGQFAGRLGIRVVGIALCGVDTPMRQASIEAQGIDPDMAQAPNISHRTNTPEEMADMVMFLATDAASSLQRTDLDVTMGVLTGPFAPLRPQGRLSL